MVTALVYEPPSSDLNDRSGTLAIYTSSSTPAYTLNITKMGSTDPQSVAVGGPDKAGRYTIGALIGTIATSTSTVCCSIYITHFLPPPPPIPHARRVLCNTCVLASVLVTVLVTVGVDWCLQSDDA